MSSPSPFNPQSALASEGPRVRINASPSARALVSQAAADFGITQRMVVDAVLGDRDFVRSVAARLGARIRQSAGLE
jgi:hypothetical protein